MWSSKSPDNSTLLIVYHMPSTGQQIKTTHSDDLSLQGSHIPEKTQVNLQYINVKTDYGHKMWT